ncbi:MAG TPA: tetratricopeptide repeat protein [Terriglobia bacterium]|nr:tetratricopeptide repeat protein [Terriglobia bacterium]
MSKRINSDNRFPLLIAPFLFFSLPFPSLAGGQRAANNAALTPEIKAHWHEAQDAQNRKDYKTAAREYRAVIVRSPRFAEAYQNLGLVYQLEGRWPDAVLAFQKALALQPSLTGANLFLGIDYCQEGEARRAIPYLTRGSEEKPELPESWSWLATAEEMQGNVATEIATLQRGLQLHPENIDLLYLLGHAYEVLGKQAVDAASAVDSNSTGRELFLAESYESNGYWSEALVHLQNALAQSPNREGVHLDLGEVFMRTGRLDSALAEVDAELKLHPYSLRARVRRGEIELLQGRLDSALADWSEAANADLARTEAILGIRETGFGEAAREQLAPGLRQKLDEIRPRLNQQSGTAGWLAAAFIASQNGGAPPPGPGMGPHVADPSQERTCSLETVQSWLRDDQLEAAARCGARVVTADSPPPLRLAVARALVETGQPESALAVLNAAPAAQAHAPELLYWKSRCYKKLALAAYLKLYAVSPECYRAHQLLGDTDAARDEDSKAIQEYRLALAQRPHLPNLHYEIGRLLWKTLKTDEARAEFDAELKLNPLHSGALIALGTISLYEHQPETAMSFLQKAAAAEPQNPDVHHFLGTAYLQMRRYREAVTELKLALHEDEDGKIHYQLARAYQSLGRKEEAAHEFVASNALNERFHSRSAQRVQRLAAAEAALKQP